MGKKGRLLLERLSSHLTSRKEIGVRTVFPRAREFITKLFSSGMGSLGGPGTNRCWLGGARAKDGSGDPGTPNLPATKVSGLWANQFSLCFTKQ